MDLDNEYAEYRHYIEEFAKTIDPDDQLPLRVAGYCLRDFEIHGECLDWLNNYLGKSCPITLRMYLIPKAMKLILEKTKLAPEECGFDENRMVFQPLKLVRIVVGIVNSLILALQDNSQLYEVPLPPSSPNATEITKLKAPMKTSSDAIKNSRRTMQDRMMIIDDFNAYFNTTDTEPTFYYGIYDGHSGSDAATYSNSHLNYNIAVHPKYPSDIETAMREAFRVTDVSFLKKAKAENLSSGTTALCAILRKTEKKLYVGWCGDSQALIARLGNVRQIVEKHSPECAKERKRIEDLGGVVLYWGNSYRVSGTLAVSRAIGDMELKPFVTAEPDIEIIDLDGEEDFVVLACDGMWDNLSEDDVAITVYKMLKEDPQSYKKVATRLCALAKESGSRDNISVIVVYLKEPHLIATQSWPSLICESNENMENMNVFDDPAMEKPVQVTMDALGNTNQDFYNNIFDANNELISEVAIGKPTEITDLVMQQQQQQPENEFVNFSDSLNNINNNKFNNGHDDIFSTQDQFEPVIPAIQIDEQNGHTSNDTNNNSNDNFGPETDVDAIDEVASVEECVKENFQVELKETADMQEQIIDSMDFGAAAVNSMNQFAGSFENKIFEEMSHQNPDLMNDFNPFNVESSNTMMETANAGFDFESFTKDHERKQQDIDEMDQMLNMQDVEKFTDEIVQESTEFVAETTKAVFDDMSANDQNEKVEETNINMQEQLPEHDAEISGSVQIVAESGGEDSEDEWNYVKVDKKASVDGLTSVEEVQELVESPIVEIKQEIIETAEDYLQEAISPVEEVKQEIKYQFEDFEAGEKRIESELVQQLQEGEEDIDDMATQLNPEAKEFVPVSPTRTGPMNNLFGAFMDQVVSQSPCKIDTKDQHDVEDNISLPTESVFDIEAEKRAHETETNATEFMNLKEAMQRDDKLEQEYKDETQTFQDEVQVQNSEEYVVLEKSFTEYSNGFQNTIDDPMNRSFYEGRDDDLLEQNTQKDILNTRQPIPTFEDEFAENGTETAPIENGTTVNDYMITHDEILPQQMAENLDLESFEPEKFVEEIKKANGDVDKYTDQGLSPTIEISPAVEEPVIVTTPAVEQQPEEIQPAVIIPDPVVIEKVVEVAKATESLVEPKKSATSAKKAATPVSKSSASSLSTVKKSPAVSKSPAASTKSPAPIKAPAANGVAKAAPKVEVKSSAAPRVGLAKKPSTITSSSTAPKPASTLASSRPKTSVSTTSTVRKTTSATSASSDKPPAVKSTTLIKKTTSAVSSAPKPTPRPASAQVKPKVPSTTTEKKPISSSAPITRAPISKPSTVPAVAKPRVPLASKASTTSTTTTTVRKTTTSRLNADKPDSVTKTTTTVTRSPRPATTVAKTSTLKSPTSAVTATKKPLVERKAATSVTTKTTTTVKKTSVSPTKAPAAIKRPTTTIVEQKKVVNGDVVVEKTTTVELNGDNQLIENLEKIDLNGHSNGVVENGSGETQMVIDTAAD